MISKEEFSLKVEEIQKKSKSYIDSVLKVSEEYDIDPSEAKVFLTPFVLGALKIEAQKKNFIKKEYCESTLPDDF